jgi:hypothetical protein
MSVEEPECRGTLTNCALVDVEMQPVFAGLVVEPTDVFVQEEDVAELVSVLQLHRLGVVFMLTDSVVKNAQAITAA